MEIKEAIEQLKWYFENDDGGAAENKTKEAAYMAIVALVEKQDKEKLKMENMTNDSINRQAAIEEIRTYIAKPNISDDESEIKGFNDGLELAISVLSVLPSAQPEQKRGKWIESAELSEQVKGKKFCSNCGKAQYAIELTDKTIQIKSSASKFCPNCGAKMNGETE